MIEAETQRRLDDLQQGRLTATGQFDLDVSPATTTTVTRRGVSSNSIVIPVAYSALASQSDITRVVPAKDQFVVTHAASANARTFRYIFITGIL